MNRNVESHFSELPKVDIPRSIFDRSCSHKTSFNVGELIPFYVDEVLPGDTFKITTSCVVRLQTPLTPIMDNIYLDTYYFFVPYRILWTHWKEFMGENTSSAWIPSTTYSMPVTIPPSGGWNVGTIADYMGIPVGQGPGTVPQNMAPSNLPFRAYAMIAQQWFSDQNLTSPVLLNLGDSNTTGSNGSNYITDLQAGGLPFKVAKYHDYFTSCLPAPQKGADVNLLANYMKTSIFGTISQNVYAPVITRSDRTPSATSGELGLILRQKNGTNSRGIGASSTSDGVNLIYANNPSVAFVPDNLWADLSAANLSINDLRIAFQLQKYYEKNARAGTRYREIIKEHFGVTTSDGRMQIPEYLGGHRFPLSIHQVANAAASSGEYLGDLGAMSNTSDVHEDFVRSFEEFGVVIGTCCVRYDHSYPQGLERMWRRINNLDFYYPVFANIGKIVCRYKIEEKIWKAAQNG